MRLLLSGVALALVMATPGYGAPAASLHVGNAVPVTIRGYHGDAMEPFLSADGKYLFFNNRNDPGTDTNLYFAAPRRRTTFSYGGAIAGANSPALDAVASMDAADHFYFVSTRSYAAHARNDLPGDVQRTDGSPASRSFRACRRPNPDGSTSTPR